MKLQTLEDLFADHIKDLYSAENQLTKALPKMAKNAESEDLRLAFEEHLAQTQQQLQRLEQIGQDMDLKVKGKKCVGMEGIIEEGKEMLEADAEPHVLDMALIGAAQKVEHYEMAAYESTIDLAEQLGYTDAADLLQQTLEEEQTTSERLTQLAGSLAGMEMESATTTSR